MVSVLSLLPDNFLKAIGVRGDAVIEVAAALVSIPLQNVQVGPHA